MEARAVIALWPSVAELADDLGEKESTVRKWQTRGRIPPKHFGRIALKARERGLSLSVADLHGVAA